MPVTVHIYIACIGLAFLVSLVIAIILKKDRPDYIIIFNVVLGILFIIELSANFFLKALGLTTNVGLYNFAMLVEFWGFGLYYYFVIEKKSWKRLLKAYLFLFPVFWAIMIFVISWQQFWNSPLHVVGSLSLIIMSAGMYYQLFTSNRPIRLFVNFEFLVATALIIFFAGNFFYFGMLNSLAKKHPALATKLLFMIHVQVMILYSIFVYAFLCLRFASRQDRTFHH